MTLNWFIATQPGGTIQEVAKRCTDESNGAYQISVNLLPTVASDQREQLVRRLAARDSTVDLVGMDVIWTAEFANAGWIRPFPQQYVKRVTAHVFPSSRKTAEFKGKLYGAPFNSNTELLWYRKDLVHRPPQTWAQMLQEANRLHVEGKPATIQLQASKYEGYTVWVNSMIASAGTQILSGPQTVALQKGPTEKALNLIGELAHSPAAATNIDTSTEDTARLGFEAGTSAFMLNYTFAYASAKANAPDVFKHMGFARYPRVDPSRPSRPPLGGFNVGVGAYSNHPDLDFEAAACLTNAKSQLTATKLDGLPPTRQNLYSSKVVTDAFPGFSGLVERSIRAAAPRPLTPVYQDISLAIQDSIQPPSKVDPNDPGAAYDTLRGDLQDAVERKGLF